MKVVSPYARIVSPLRRMTEGTVDQAALMDIEAAARISHRSEDCQTQETYMRFLRAVVLERGDWSVVEHVTVSVELLVDRGITHELVRHRLFSFTQESTRFVNYEKKLPPTFVYPIVQLQLGMPEVELRWLETMNSHEVEQGWHVFDPKDGARVGTSPFDEGWVTSIDQAEKSYRRLLSVGWRPQEARSVFPNALASKILMTGNLRNWRHFFQMRTSREAHPQMRQVTIPLLSEFQRRFPILFEDVVPEEQQAKAIRKGR